MRRLGWERRRRRGVAASDLCPRESDPGVKRVNKREDKNAPRSLKGGAGEVGCRPRGDRKKGEIGKEGGRRAESKGKGNKAGREGAKRGQQKKERH